jgi:RimJ/RimL family protein N-acetyltransferase
MSWILETERLLLRPPKATDISRFMPLLDDFEVSKNLARVPYPYTEDDGCAFIVKAAKGWATREDLTFAVLRKADAAYIGMCGVHPARGWEFGYWFGKPYWGKGYATEAGARIVAFAFEVLNAEKLCAGWFYDNPASGCVLEKLGFGACGEEARSCLSRGLDVQCHMVVLDRAAYMTRKSAS